MDFEHFLPQIPGPDRSWDVDAQSKAEPGIQERAYPEELETTFRDHYQRVTRTIGRSYLIKPVRKS